MLRKAVKWGECETVDANTVMLTSNNRNSSNS